MRGARGIAARCTVVRPPALMAAVMEALPTDSPMAVVRMTVEIFRPVPLRPVEVAARIERPGHRVQMLTATLTDGNTELCRATAWRMRIADLDLGEQPALEVPFAGPADSVAHVPESDDPAFHRTGMEMRYARGSFIEVGPATVWMRLAVPLIAGQTPTPLQRTLAAADFGNGVASALPWGQFLFINTDLTVSLPYTPQGEWIGRRTRSTDINVAQGLATRGDRPTPGLYRRARTHRPCHAIALRPATDTGGLYSMQIKGVNYDVGTVMGVDWRPDYDPKVVDRELEIIRTTCTAMLSASAVKTLGACFSQQKPPSVKVLKPGSTLQIGVTSPLQPTLAYITDAAKAAQPLHERHPGKVVLSIGSEFTLFMQGIVPGKTFRQRANTVFKTDVIKTGQHNQPLNDFLGTAVARSP